jgi:mycothiol synthase
MSVLDIEEVDYRALTEAQIVAINEFENAMRAEARPEDPPEPLEHTRAVVTNHPSTLVIREFWLREPGSPIAGLSYLYWRNTEDNRHLAWAGVSVRAEHRGRGLAKQLLSLIVPIAEREGRSLLSGMTTDRVPAGDAFARRLGADGAQAVHTNRLLMADLDAGLVRRWIEQGPSRAPGYSLVFFDGPFPDDVIENAVAAYHIMNTAPRDDLDWEDHFLTVEEMREIEKQGIAQGSTRWLIFAREDSTGRFVGLSEIFRRPYEPQTVYQGDTGVHPDHRGHALGKWMKAEMLERITAQWPEVTSVRTGNADSNDAMLGINRALGFKPYIAQTNWQVPVEKVRAYLAGSSV